MVLQAGRLPEHRQRQSSAVSTAKNLSWNVNVDFLTGWTIIAGQTARRVLPWEGQMLYMARSTISYYYSAELQTSLRRIGLANSGRWHSKEATGFLLPV